MKTRLLLIATTLLCLAHSLPAQYLYKNQWLKKDDLVRTICEDLTEGECPDEALCKQGVENALLQVSENEAVLYYFEYPSMEEIAFFYVLKQRYQVRAIYVHDNLYARCYNAMLSAKLTQRHGSNFWSQVMFQADSLNQLGWGTGEIQLFIQCALPSELLVEDAEYIPQVLVRCVIDEQGRLRASTVVKGYNKVYDEAALELLRSIPKWKPVPMTIEIPVIFDKRNNCG